MNGLGGTGGWDDQTAVRRGLTGEVWSHPGAGPARYTGSRRGGEKLGSMCFAAVTTETGAGVQTLGNGALGMHVEAHVNQRTRGRRTRVPAEAHATASVTARHSRHLPPTATASWDLAAPARRAGVRVWMRSNLRRFLIFWRTQGFPCSMPGFETGALVPRPQRAVTSQRLLISARRLDAQEGPFPGNCSEQHPICPAPLGLPHSCQLCVCWGPLS